VNRVKNDRVGDTAIVVDLDLQFLVLLFTIVLDYFDSLDYNVFENSLSLFNVACVGIGVFIKFSIKLFLELHVHLIPGINGCIHFTYACS
jgi:hypothetical protein